MTWYVIFIAGLHTVPVLLTSFIFSSRLFTFIAALIMVFIALTTGAERYNILDAGFVVVVWLRLVYIESKAPDPTEEEEEPKPEKQKESDSLNWIASLFIAIIIFIAAIFLGQSDSDVAVTPSTTYQPQQYNINQTPDSLTPIYPVVSGNTNQNQEPIQTPRDDDYSPPPQPEFKPPEFTPPNNPYESIQYNQKPILPEVKQKVLPEAKEKVRHNGRASSPCVYKGVMSNEDYYNCGVSPPQIYPVVYENTNQNQQPIQTPKEDYYWPPSQTEHSTSDSTRRCGAYPW